MIGLLILAIAGLYVAFWVWVVVTAKKRSVKIAAILVALAIPFYDVPFGYFAFQRYCSKEGGLHLAERFSAASAVLLDESVAYRPEELLAGFGFKTIELRRRGSFVRYTLEKNQPAESLHPTPISTVSVQSIRNQSLSWNITRGDMIAAELATGRVIARHTDFTLIAPWWRAEAAPLLGYGRNCFARTGNPVLRAVARGSK